jgi:O-antigen ligase
MPDVRFVTALPERIAYGLLILLALTFPFDITLWASAVADASWSSVRLEVAALLGVWLLALVAARRRPRSLPAGIIAAGVANLGVLLVSAIMAPNHGTEALKSWARVASGLALGYAAFDLTRACARRRGVAVALAVAGIAVALLGLAEAVDVKPVPAWLEIFKYGPAPVQDLHRVSSSLPNPNITAMVMELTVPLMLAWSFAARSTWGRWVLRGAAVVAMAMLVLTFSRAGLVAFVLSVIILILGSTAGQRRWARPVGVLAAAGLGLTILVLPAVMVPALFGRLTEELSFAQFNVSYVVPSRLDARRGAVELVPIRLTNLSRTAWNAAGPGRFGLGYHVWNTDGSAVSYDGPATPLPRDVPPGGSIDIVGRLSISKAGTYRIEWDAVQEGGMWSSWTGTPSATTTVQVDDAAPSGDSRVAAADGKPIKLPPFSRVLAWTTGLRMVASNPLLGVGPDNYRWRFRDYSGVDLSNIGIHAHNIYLEWLADGGVFGFLTTVWFSLELLRAAWSGLGGPTTRVIRDRADDRVWRLALVAALAAWFAHGLLDDFYRYTPTLAAFCLITGLTLSYATNRAVSGDHSVVEAT